MAKDHPTGNSGLYRAFLQLKTPEECYRFLQDVCSYSELSAMEQRYNIAELLADKCIYTEIMDKTAGKRHGVGLLLHLLAHELQLSLGGSAPDRTAGAELGSHVRPYHARYD